MMTRRKKIGLALLILLVLSQLPFAYRRYRLGQLHAAIQQINAQRSNAPAGGVYSEYKGVMHVHSFLGGHSSGNFEEILAAAHNNQLNFVVMTEHVSANFNTAAMTLKGVHGGVLFVNGNEVAARNGERLLVAPGDERSNDSGNVQAAELIQKVHGENRLAFVAYPHDFKSWSEPFDGIEIYNVYTNAREINPLIMFFDGLWSYRAYPDLLFARFFDRPNGSLQQWDQLTSSGRKVTAVAGNDAHANIGFRMNSSSGKRFPVVQLDPYERSFRLVRLHVLVPNSATLTVEALLSALRDGHCFIGFDIFGDSSGFAFTAASANQQRIQGDEVALVDDLKLSVAAPVSSRVVLYRNGNVIQDDRAVTKREYPVTEKGVYRVEVFLPQLPIVGDKPWIFSNAIYVR